MIRDSYAQLRSSPIRAPADSAVVAFHRGEEVVLCTYPIVCTVHTVRLWVLFPFTRARPLLCREGRKKINLSF